MVTELEVKLGRIINIEIKLERIVKINVGNNELGRNITINVTNNEHKESVLTSPRMDPRRRSYAYVSSTSTSTKSVVRTTTWWVFNGFFMEADQCNGERIKFGFDPSLLWSNQYVDVGADGGEASWKTTGEGSWWCWTQQPTTPNNRIISRTPWWRKGQRQRQVKNNQQDQGHRDEKKDKLRTTNKSKQQDYIKEKVPTKEGEN